MDAAALVLIFIGLSFFACVLPAFGVARFAVYKGKEFWPWFWGGILFWPIGAILLLLTPTPGAQARPRTPSPLSPRRLKQLEDLGRLRESGALTEQEFEQEKAKLLGRPSPPPAAPDNLSGTAPPLPADDGKERSA